MKAGRTLPELAAELYRQANSKRDYIADTLALRTRVDGTTNAIVLDGVGDGLPLRPTAHEQMGSTLGIPKSYYDRMMSDAPDLLVNNINHWLTAQPAKRMIRTLDGGVRAILSDRYRPLDNLDLAEAVLPQLERLDANVVSGEITEGRFFLKAVTPRVQSKVKKGDIIQAGLVISNSEIGAGALRIEELTYRLICLNGAIHAQAVRQTHAGRPSSYAGADLLEQGREFFKDETRQADDRAFFLKVRDAVAGSLTQDRLDKHLLAMNEAAEIKPDADPVKVVEVTAAKFGLGDAERGSVLKHLIEGGDLSAFGIGNAITRASQDVADYVKATEMELVGGKVYELSSSDWKALLA
jgi:hypothetical protein